MKKLPATNSATTGAPTILTVRGKRVILDSELAALYGVPTKRLNQQVRRNAERFPRDFAFLLSSDEWESSRSQIDESTSCRRNLRHRVGEADASCRLRSRNTAP